MIYKDDGNHREEQEESDVEGVLAQVDPHQAGGAGGRGHRHHRVVLVLDVGNHVTCIMSHVSCHVSRVVTLM